MRSLSFTFIASVFCLFSCASALADEVGAPKDWPQAHLDVPADPSVLFGQLPNGMRYAIKSNEKPTDAISIRLRIGSGSFVEKEDELGIAHFLEHMAFRGSAHFPDGELVKSMERLGLRFGADTNAYTGREETVYQFDLAKNDPQSLSTGLGILRDIASRLNLAKASIESERGVVLAEERVRSTPDSRVWDASQAFILEGQIAAGRNPIGTVATINSVDRSKLLAFYRANYQPQNATLVVVGSIDPKRIEALIQETFSDWENKINIPKIDYGSVKSRGLSVRSMQQEGVSESVKLFWIMPPDKRPKNLSVERQTLSRYALIRAINERLYDFSQSANSPIVKASVGFYDEFHSADAFVASITPVSGRTGQALAVVQLLRSTVENGISRQELHRALDVQRIDSEAYAKAKDTLLNSDISQYILDSVSDARVYISPETYLSEANIALAQADIESANAGLKRLMVGSGPLLFHAAPQLAANDSAEMEGTLRAALAQPVKPYAAEAEIVWPYRDFGPLGRVAARTHDRETDITFVEFANGTRLAIKPTKYVIGNANVRVRFGGGLLSLPAGQEREIWNTRLLTDGGTTKLTAPQINKSLAQFSVEAKFRRDSHGFWLDGNLQTKDMPVEMQLMTALYSDAAFRTDTFEAAKANAKAHISASDADPASILSDEYDYLTFGQRPQWKRYRDPNELDDFKVENMVAFLRDQMSGPVDVSVVGDVQVDDTINQVAATFGALQYQSQKRWDVGYPEASLPSDRAEPYVFYHKGRADQGALALVWGTDWYFANVQDTYSLTIAARILNTRLNEIVRSKLGIGYSPSAWLNSSNEFKGMGEFGVMLELPMHNFEVFRQLVLDQVHDIAVNGITSDELERAQKPELEARQKALEQNGVWVEWTAGLLHDADHTRPLISNYVKGYEAVTAEHVLDAVRRRLDGKAPLTIEVVPQVAQ